MRGIDVPVDTDANDGFDCIWLPGLYGRDGMMQDGEDILVPPAVRKKHDIEIKMTIGIYKPIAPIFRMDPFNASLAEEKIKERFFVLAEGDGFVLNDPVDGYIHCFGRVEGQRLDQYECDELQVAFQLECTQSE